MWTLIITLIRGLFVYVSNSYWLWVEGTRRCVLSFSWWEDLEGDVIESTTMGHYQTWGKCIVCASAVSPQERPNLRKTIAKASTLEAGWEQFMPVIFVEVISKVGCPRAHPDSCFKKSHEFQWPQHGQICSWNNSCCTRSTRPLLSLQ